MKAVVIGAGASGMMCAGGLARAGHEVTVIEKNEKPGKKLFITGKGRCNLTNDCDVRTFLDNVVTNPRFLNSAVYGFTPADCMEFFTSLGVKLKTERGNRVFPVSDKSNDIVKALEKYSVSNGADIRYNEKAVEIVSGNGEIKCVRTDKGVYPCDVAVIATGGVTYPVTGSTGDGYAMAAKLASVYFGEKEVASDFGEMLFTHTGVSGPIILSISSKIGKYCDKSGKSTKGGYISVDLKPALDFRTLDARLLREFSAAPRAVVKTVLYTLMPKALAPKILVQCGIDGEVKSSEVSRKQREALVTAIKGMKFDLKGKDKTDLGIITQGGVDVSEINPKDMSSRKIKGLYVIGEALDVDALTGGFNLQIAFSTANAVVRALL